MADGQTIIESAVIVPDLTDQLVPSPLASKRRQSSLSDSGNKRLRLSQEIPPSREDVESPVVAVPIPLAKNTASVQVEERKRGKRLFGALLGTLAQSSSSTAHKRRVDIERKQQAKLKLQDEEYDEKTKKRLDALLENRRREQRSYDKQSMQIRHSNLLASAHFLQTAAQPKLYYKPWDLSAEEEAKIESQVEGAEALVRQESTIYKAQEAGWDEEPAEQEAEGIRKPLDSTMDLKTVGQTTNDEESVDPSNPLFTNPKTAPEPETTARVSPTPDEVPKDHIDDGGDVVVDGEEDMVIY
ncbi:hypothetical protein MMC19_007515 [Ptychographa xylographoides]|nr:hypothetical protein [Ptychographa xylographoides]